MPATLTAVIVASDFHRAIADAMVAAATDELQRLGVTISDVARVPGSYEMPLFVDHVLAYRKPSLVVVLGFIEKGETLHGEVMGHVVHAKLIDLQLQYKTPIGLGLIGPGATLEQVELRKERAARGAAQAAVGLFDLLQKQ